MKVAALLVVCVVLLATSTDAMSAGMQKIMANKKEYMNAENMAKFQSLSGAAKARIMEMYKAGDMEGLKALRAKMEE